MQKSVAWRHIVIFRNQRTWSTPLDPKQSFGAFRSIWVHLGSFRNCMKLGAKWGELVQLMQKFVPRSQVGILRNECTQSAPFDPKLMFLCVS